MAFLMTLANVKILTICFSMQLGFVLNTPFILLLNHCTFKIIQLDDNYIPAA